MVYRIRYRAAQASHSGEVVVEANSPNEAVVKFRHAPAGRPAGRHSDVVTSVRAEDSDDSQCPAWS
jgi:hypothetical protein